MNLFAFLAALLLAPAALADLSLRDTVWSGEVEHEFELKIDGEKFNSKTSGFSEYRFKVRSFLVRGDDGMIRGTYHEGGRGAKLVLRNRAVAKLKRAAVRPGALLSDRTTQMKKPERGIGR